MTDELNRLAKVAKNPNLVDAVYGLPDSEFAAWMCREHAAYYAPAGASATDAGAAAWMREKWGEAQRAWTRDVDRVLGREGGDGVRKTK
jgi:hypothetical protein